MERVPRDRVKFIAIGAAVLVSGVLAAVSMAFALRLAIPAPVPVAIVFGILWGFWILSLNRFLVASIPRQRNWRSAALLAAPRICLTLLTAIIIATPIELQIFSSQVSAEIPVIQHSQLNEYLAQQKTSPVAVRIAADQAKVGQLQQTIATQGLVSPYNYPVVASLIVQLTKARTQANADYKRWQCLLYGGPECIAGNGPLAKVSEQIYQGDLEEIGSLNEQIAKAVAQVNQAAQANQEKAVATARAALPAAQEQLQADQRRQAQALANFDQANRGTGILIQLKAFYAVTAGSAVLTAARYLLLVFFIAIDLLPLATRLALVIGPPTTYDEVIANDERVLAEAARRNADTWLLADDRRAAQAEAEAAAMERLRDRENWSRSFAPFTEKVVRHGAGELYRLEISADEFVLVDILDGAPTLNWTASIGAREFAALVSKRLDRATEAGEPEGEITVSMAGISDQFDARLGVQLASLASPAFDQRSEFIRFDDADIALALQSLHGDCGEHVTLFGVSRTGLSLDTVTSLMARTATSNLAAHARRAEQSQLIGRIAALVHLPPSGDPWLTWHLEGQVKNEQARR